MRNIQLLPFAQNDENFPPDFCKCLGLRQMIVGSYFKYLRFEKELTPRFLKNVILKREKSSGERLFWLFIRSKGLDNFSGTTLGDFANHIGYNFVFWAGAHYTNGMSPSHKVSSNIGVLDCHFTVPAVYRRRLFDNYKLEKLPKLGFLNKSDAIEEIIEIHNPRKTIAEWISEKSKQSVETVIDQIKNIYGDRIPFHKERLFFNNFGFGFQISRRDYEAEKQQTDRATVILKKSNCQDFLNLEFDGEPPPRRYITMTDMFNLTEKVKIYSCPNKWCSLPPNSRLDVINDHIQICTNETKYSYEAKKMTEGGELREFMEKNNFIPKDFSKDHFTVFDIECLGLTDNAGQISAKSTEISDQKIATIAFGTTFGVPTKVIKRNSFSQEDYIAFYQEIISHIRLMASEYAKTIPTCIFEAISKIQCILSTDRKSESNNLDVYRKSMLQKSLNHLQQITVMRIYGYNSEKYDQPLILPGILSVLKLKSKESNIIRRGTGLMMMGIDLGMESEVLFLDAYNLSAGGSLAVFAKTFGAEQSKGTFPYEHFQSISEMKDCKFFPKYQAFKSSLKFPERESFDTKFRAAYEKARTELNMTADKFLDQMSIPTSCYELSVEPNQLPEIIDYSSVHCTLDPLIYVENLIEYNFLTSNLIIENMFDFLCLYNKKDVDILKEALLNYCDLFKKNLDVNPLDFLTIPSIAETLMWRFFDEIEGAPFSLSEREINELITKNNFGGATIILGVRHQEINVDEPDRVYPAKVYTTPNGMKIIIIQSLDFNNLYGHGIRMRLPVGKGKHYVREGKLFKWSPVTGSDNYSLDCIEWLNWKQSDFLKPDGTRYVIAHALNKGEIVIDDDSQNDDFGILPSKRYKPDGFVTVDGVDHFFEFDGCHVHQCPHNCLTYRKTISNENRITPRDVEVRNQFYRSRGELHTITSCEWYKLRKNLKFKNYTSCFFRSKNITEEVILEKIKSDDFFGVIVVDIESPPEVVKRFSEVGFGTVFRHMEVTEQMIHPTYLTQLKASKRPFPLDKVLTLAFHGKQLLITTEFAKFYMNLGVKLTNITEALEYECGKPLENFVNSITEQRKEATRTKNTALQNVFKLVANRFLFLIYIMCYLPTS